MGRLGDGSPVGVRRAHALGLLAHPQRVLELFGTEPSPSRHDRPSRHRAGVERHPGDALPPRHHRRPPRRCGRRSQPRRLGGAARRRHPGAAGRLAAPHRPGHRPPGPRPDPAHPGRPARPARVDARGGHPARRALRLPRLHRRRPVLRPRPHRRPTSHPTTADHPARPASRTSPACAATPPPEDLHRLDLPRAPDDSYVWVSPHGTTFTVSPDHRRGPRPEAHAEPASRAAARRRTGSSRSGPKPASTRELLSDGAPQAHPYGVEPARRATRSQSPGRDALSVP